MDQDDDQKVSFTEFAKFVIKKRRVFPVKDYQQRSWVIKDNAFVYDLGNHKHLIEAIIDYEFDANQRGFAVSAPNLIQEKDLNAFAFVLYNRDGPCLNFLDFDKKEIIW